MNTMENGLKTIGKTYGTIDENHREIDANHGKKR